MNISSENQISYCLIEQKGCIGWAERYFKDCLCNQKDYFSFGFGIVSLFCWAVAQIPQIVTNFGTNSSHGVSTLFLLTWVLGDMFNLVGCILEPATLYTVTTIILLLQSLYYDYLHNCLMKANKDHSKEEGGPLPFPRSFKLRHWTDESGVHIPNLRFNNIKGPGRSMAGSTDSSSNSDDDEETNRPSTISSNSSSQPTPIPRSVGYVSFLAMTMNMPHQSNALLQVYTGLAGRKLLQDSKSSERYIIGQCLGWMMVAIYMGSRIPQIWLNIKRGSVEGLNPLMFIFAIIANVAYVGSILVRSTEWDKIRANLPWLLDAATCVMLDTFIISQYIYYRYYQEQALESQR